MKSRSHRIPIVEPRHDDWVDESWTVDCICGVNFDDGEEMVNCDECGVWVHTRCSRYVKSEQSFACDKCKGKNVGISIRNENEETEVAEFLVELPTKTLRMDKPNPIFNNPNPAVVSSRRPLRLSIPMEDRVHVQGVPGGDPGLFSGIGMSSIFGPELWKATGYVPKKFNFRYNEFPCWGDDKTGEEEDKEMDKKSDERNVSQADNGAGVLFQLSKDGGNKLPMAVVKSVGVKSSDEDGGCHEIVSPRHKKLDGKHLVCSEERLKKKSSSVQSFVLYAGKCKKENLGLSKDRSSTKKVRTIEQELDVNRRTPHSSRSVASTFSSDSKQSESFQDRGSKATSDVIHSGKDVLGECATNLASNECGPEATTRKNVSSDVISKEENTEDKVPRRCDNFSKTCGTLTVLDNSRATVAKEKVFRDDLQSCTDAGPVAVNVTLTGSDVKERDTGQDTQIDEADSRPNKKLKARVDNDDHASLHLQSLPLDDVTLDTTNDTTRHAAYFSAVFSQEDHKASPKSEASQHEVHVGSRNVANCRADKSDDTPENSSQFKQEPESEGSVGARKRPSGQTDGSEVAGDLVKSDSAVKSHSTALYHRKVVVSVGKSAPNSTNNNVHISSSIKRMAAASAKKPSIDSRLKEMSESCVGTMKDSSLIETVKYDEKYVRSKKLLKESSRLNSESKVQAPKLSSTSDLKRMSSGSKDSTIPSSKVSVVSSACTTTQGESSSPPLTEPSNVQNKATVSAVSSKGEKFEQSSSRGNAPSMNAFAIAMSDEELAKLLHQELNSSPRVPRVPRLRNAGNLPQVTVSTGTSMLMKRTSSSGGKDHSMASKWKTKDSSRDGSHGSLEVNDEPKKIDRKHSSSDKRRRDTGVDTISRRDARSGASKDVHSNVQRRPSSKNMSDDDPKNRTLPGLIAEIMSEGKRMTYEELCNAVLPHWPHVRKHNGERYAYSTHSQAVLDCLRNRSEWARLVDRGPKTTSVSRKRRKTDGDSVSFDSEDINDDNTRIDASDIFESHQEELFPKGGKRKSRKGSRRLALQPGRGGTVRTRRRRAVSVTSDDESESFSNSSSENNTMSSEEEENLQGGGAAASRSASEDSSASSDRSST